MPLRLEVDNLTIRFRLSHDKTWTLAQKAQEFARRLLRGQELGHFTAVDDVSLRVAEGDIVGVIGPNGCGKTTLLRAIAGIYWPDGGAVRRHGRVSTLLSLGTGFDNRSNGLDNIRLNGLIMGMSDQEIDARIPEIVAFADIGEHIYKPMKYYSNGMISRVSFAIVLAMQPDILLIDEVFSVGDLEFQKKSESAMHKLLSKAACQVIVTHNLHFVRSHCNRALYLRNGKVIADGTPVEVVRQYERDSSSHVGPLSKEQPNR